MVEKYHGQFVVHNNCGRGRDDYVRQEALRKVLTIKGSKVHRQFESVMETKPAQSLLLLRLEHSYRASLILMEEVCRLRRAWMIRR